MKKSRDNKTLTLKNFRVFDAKGASIEFSPITILTGCNSSGKSSIVKSLVLIESYLDKLNKDVTGKEPLNISGEKMDFSTFPNNLLGNFNNILNSKSKSKDVTYEFSTYSHMLGEHVVITMIFSTESEDELKNGYLKYISFANEKREILYQSSIIDTRHFDFSDRGNLNLLINAFSRYLKLENAIRIHEDYLLNPEADYTTEQIEELKKEIDLLKEEYGKDSLKDVVWYLKNSPFSREDSYILNDNNFEALSIFEDTNILFYLPILEELNKASDIDKLLKLKISNTLNKKFRKICERCIDKEVDFFKESKIPSFLNYFKKLEEDFIKKNNPGTHRLFYGGGNPPFLLSRDDLNISDCIIGYYFDASEGSSEYYDVEKDLMRKETKEEENQRINKWENRHSFETLFGLLADLTQEDPDFSKYCNVHDVMGFPSLHCKRAEAFTKFAKNMCEMLLTIEIPMHIHYISSSIVPIKRFYPLDNNDLFTQSLKEYLEAKRLQSKKKNANYMPDTFMNKWVKIFEIGNYISVKSTSKGYGVSITINKNNGKKCLLSEEGYGISQLFALLLRIETLILKTQDDKNYVYKPYKATDFVHHTIAIEEPEIHFHPKFQSMLADMFIDAYLNHKINFIIETHSEYLIRKLQVMVAKKEVDSSVISIAYIDHPDKKKRDGSNQVRNITIQENGILSESFGNGFYDEASRLALELF